MANDRRKKKRRFRSTGQFIGLLLLTGLFALNALVALASLSQRKYSVSVGSAAPETIRATREIEDVGATETRKQAARAAVETVFALDEELANTLISGVESFLTRLPSCVPKRRRSVRRMRPWLRMERPSRTTGPGR